jgi:glucan phosphorylase
MRQRFGDDWARIARLSIIEETASGEKTVRMAYLAVIASAHVNGVAKIHSGGARRRCRADIASRRSGCSRPPLSGCSTVCFACCFFEVYFG